MVKVTVFGVALLSGASLGLAGVIERRNITQEGPRLVKTSEDDSGTWMTEEEKFSNLISKKIGFVDITDTQDLENVATNTVLAFPTGPSHTAVAEPLVSQASSSNLWDWIHTMINFYNRSYLGTWNAEGSLWMYNTVVGIASVNSSIQVTKYTHSYYDQPSVIAKIPGTSSSVVIVSAHYDSIGATANGPAPGADDNASGVAVLLESLRVLANAGYSPTNTLEFHFYSGQEGGLLGSRDIMQSYVKSGVDVLAVLNQEKAGWSPKNVIGVYTDYVNTDLTNFIVALVPVYTDITAVTDVCGYGCGDHESANKAGFAASYVTGGTKEFESPYIHTAQDNLNAVGLPHILQHIKLTIGFLVEASYFGHSE